MNEQIDLVIDPSEFTLGELEDLETAAGKPFSTIQRELAANEAHARTMIALVWVAERRKNPAFTLEAARAIKITNITPTSPAVGGDRSGPPA